MLRKTITIEAEKFECRELTVKELRRVREAPAPDFLDATLTAVFPRDKRIDDLPASDARRLVETIMGLTNGTVESEKNSSRGGAPTGAPPSTARPVEPRD